jgi:hypothetical protein
MTSTPFSSTVQHASRSVTAMPIVGNQVWGAFSEAFGHGASQSSDLIFAERCVSNYELSGSR